MRRWLPLSIVDDLRPSLLTLPHIVSVEGDL
jgi:hypothetical protein